MFYTNCDPNNPVCTFITNQNRDFIRLLDAIHTVDIEDTDFDAHMVEVGAMLGITSYQAERTFVVKFMLDRLRSFRHLCEELGHLDLQRLYAACDPAFRVRDDILPELDRRLTNFLTPSKEHQQLPAPRAIRTRMRQWIEELAPQAPDPDNPSGCSAEFSHSEGTSFLDAQFPEDIGRELHHVVKTAAEQHGLTMGEALVQLIRGQLTATVTWNVFETPQGVYLSNVGWLPDQAATEWAAKTTRTRDVTEDIFRHTANYRPTPAMRTFVQGRDGTCRFPGCHVPAERCDIDHVIPFPEGPTTPRNLQSLCRHHHNMKTDGRVSAEMHNDGSVMWTVPQGPLADLAQHWGMSIERWVDLKRAA